MTVGALGRRDFTIIEASPVRISACADELVFLVKALGFRGAAADAAFSLNSVASSSVSLVGTPGGKTILKVAFPKDKLANVLKSPSGWTRDPPASDSGCRAPWR